jgi:hypothetical protein
MRPGLAWLTVFSLGAPLPARGDTVVVVEGPDGLVRALEERGHRVLRRADVEARLGHDEEAVDPARLAKVRTLAAEGREALYAGADLGVASERLLRALRLAAEAGEGALPDEELARLHLDLGVARLGAGARDEAEREVALALELDPALELDTSVHGPPVRRLVERLRGSRGGARRETRRAGDGALREALAAAPGDSGAALAIAEALGADLVVSVRRERSGRWTARVVGPARAEGRLAAASLAELAAGIDAGDAVGAGGTSPVARPRAEDDGPSPWWWLGAGAAVLVVGVVVGAVVLTADDGDAGRTVVAEFDR